MIFLSWQFFFLAVALFFLYFLIVTSTSIPIKTLQYPSLIFCSNGYDQQFFLAGFVRQIQQIFKKYNNKTFHYNPYEVSKIMSSPEVKFVELLYFISDQSKLNLHIIVKDITKNWKLIHFKTQLNSNKIYHFLWVILLVFCHFVIFSNIKKNTIHLIFYFI